MLSLVHILQAPDPGFCFLALVVLTFPPCSELEFHSSWNGMGPLQKNPNILTLCLDGLCSRLNAKRGWFIVVAFHRWAGSTSF